MFIQGCSRKFVFYYLWHPLPPADKRCVKSITFLEPKKNNNNFDVRFITHVQLFNVTKCLTQINVKTLQQFEMFDCKIDFIFIEHL